MVAYSFKKRFAERLEHGLRIHLDEDASLRAPPKRQTIRHEGKRRHARVGETIQLYIGMRTKDCKKIGDARCTNIRRIRIDVLKDTLMIWLLEDDGSRTGGAMTVGGMNRFAQGDGFENAKDMHAFWQAEHGKKFRGEPFTFTGFVIQWEPLSNG